MMLLSPQIWRLGLKSLWLHPLRSMLTVLGIFIGIASVVWLLAIGEGISREAQRQIEQLGATNIMLRSVLPPEETMSNDAFYVKYGILRSDVAALTRIPTIKEAIRIRETYREAHAGPVTLASHLVGCTAEYAKWMQLEIESGRFISDIDTLHKENVCVLAAGTAERFFPAANPLGQAIRIREIPYVVVGVMKPRTPMAGIGSSLAAQDFTQDIYIPLDTFWQRIGDQVLFVQAGQRSGEEIQLSQITFQVEATADVLPTAEAIRRTMGILHEKADYAVVVPLELLERARTTRMMFMVFMGMIAAVTLIVGGIGIMNIMLATVTERTREIGIRRALGARRQDITYQFLAESIVLSAVGGLTGILGGLTCPWFFAVGRSFLLRSMPNAMGSLPESIQSLTPQIVGWSIPLAFGIAVITGVCFGIYPAIRAAQMDPIEALRHE
jgi:putative ABC transport system permease protein